MRAMTLFLLGAAAASSAGCGPTVEQADMQVRELRATNLDAAAAAFDRAGRRLHVRLRALAPVPFLAKGGSTHVCFDQEAPASVRLTSGDLAVTVSCSEARPDRQLWTGTLADGSPVVLLRADGASRKFAFRGREVLVVTATPHVVDRARVVYPGGCNEMPSPMRFGPDFLLFVFRGRERADFRFVSEPYDAVDIDRTCEHPVE